MILKQYDVIMTINGKKMGDRIWAESPKDIKDIMRKKPIYRMFGIKMVKIIPVKKSKIIRSKRGKIYRKKRHLRKKKIRRVFDKKSKKYIPLAITPERAKEIGEELDPRFLEEKPTYSNQPALPISALQKRYLDPESKFYRRPLKLKSGKYKGIGTQYG